MSERKGEFLWGLVGLFVWETFETLEFEGCCLCGWEFFKRIVRIMGTRIGAMAGMALNFLAFFTIYGPWTKGATAKGMSHKPWAITKMPLKSHF